MAVNKRRVVSLLPAINQTKALTDFFGVTADQLYQPGTSTAVNGYIGEIPPLYDVPWASNTYYNVGVYVVYNELLYQCVTANTSTISFDPTLWAISDFYIQEPDEERQNYQLEPGMVSTNTSGVITNALNYPDLINYISDNNGVVSNQQRLFETDYYSWAPPIDIDKFVNYSQYYWFGDLTGSAQLPSLVLSSPILSFVGDGVTLSFAFPSSVNGIPTTQETPAIYVDEISVTYTMVGGNAVLLVAPVLGAKIITTRFDNLASAIEGQVAFPISAFLSYSETYTGDGYTNVFMETAPTWAPLTTDAIGYYVTYNNVTYECIIAHTSTNIFVPANWIESNQKLLSFANQVAVYYNTAGTTTQTLLSGNTDYTISGTSITMITLPNYGDDITIVSLNGLLGLLTPSSDQIPSGLSTDTTLSALSSGMSIQLLDTQSYFQTWNAGLWNNGPFDAGASIYFVDGVGQSIRLSPSSLIITGLTAQYVTIDRSSLDQNPWSIRNSWVHASTFAWSGETFSSRQAVRPIIEFVKDIVLFDYGYKRYPNTISAILSNNTAMTSGGATITPAQIIYSQVGTVYADPIINASGVSNSVIITPGMLLLVLGVTQELYLVGESNNFYTLTAPETLAVPYDIVTLSETSTEYWLNGSVWSAAQTWSESTNPKFMLYDIEPLVTPLNDPNTYPGSNFSASSGNEIFSYQVGTTLDPVLAIYINYDANGYIMFENNTVTDTYTYTSNGVSTDITSLVCYGVSTNFSTTNSLQTQSLWYKSTDPVTTTQAINSSGFYDIPVNLEANPLWDDVTTFSKSQCAAHFASIISNQIGITGTAYYTNNYRDTLRNLGSGTQILQHQAPLLKSMLVASDTTFDIPAAIRYANQEYTRFKNKFAKKLNDLYTKGLIPQVIDSSTGEATIADNNACAILALNSLKIDKNNSFPFWLSTMGGANYFIPPTPAFLGIMPATLPSQSLIIDTTYEIDIPMIQGHDGSLSPAFQDWRDNVFIALETMIYQSIPAQFTGMNSVTIDKTILDQLRPVFDIDQYISGRFYTAPNGYQWGELVSILSPVFELWVQIGHFDFRTNTSYDAANPFSWNYRGCLDRYGTKMPGSWRAIYNLYYDTDRPHTNPWEMLGFTSQPSWWIANYGTNYSRGNTSLWSDLETGTIRSGIREGVDPRYARPGLSKVIPVDTLGNLLDPISTQIIIQGPNAITAARNWVFGDEGPVEHLWRTSSSYPFAKSQAAFLMKPARFTEILWDTINLQFINDQWVDIRTRQRPIITADTLVHGELETNGTTYTVVFGIQQWIVDNIVYAGQSPSVFGNAIRGIDVNLVHRMAGFISSDGITTQTDNFGLIPAENVAISLYQAPPNLSTTYSGVIVEWTGYGYRVIGYDAKQPSFTIIPPNTNSLTGIISLATAGTPQVTIYTWASNTYYRVGIYVNYQNSVYQCITAHTSSAQFNESYWTPTPGVTSTVSPSIITYASGVTYTSSIPYGSVFSTIQDVGNFLLSWERYLITQGWVFDQLDSTTSTTFNWTHAAKDFLTWAQVSWQQGNFIALSPGATGLKFVTAQGTILNVEDSITGFYGLVDRAGQPIDGRTARVNRLDGEILLNSINADIYGCTIEVSDIEHIIVFSNTTIFNDIIYVPLYNQRQPRILLTGFKSSEWAGRLDAPGYVVLGNQMLSNFEKTPEDIRLMFDIEQASRPDLKAYAQYNVGYQSRDYLETLLINSTEQFEFYQGMIAQKGAPGVFEKLLRSQRVTSNSDIVFLEEWAIRYPTTFGAPINPIASFNLLQETLYRDPQFIAFYVPVITSPDWIYLPSAESAIALWQANTLYELGAFVYYNNFVYECTETYMSGAIFDETFWQLTNGWLDQPATNFFPNLVNTTPKVPTAGFARTTDVQYTSLGISNLSTFYTSQLQLGITPFSTGERIWVYTNAQNTWDILRVFDVGVTACTVNNVVSPSQDSTVTTARLYMTGTMNLQTSDIGAMIVIQGSTYSTPDLNGINYILAFDNIAGTIDVTTSVTTGFNFASSTNIPPTVKIIRSVRYTTDTIFNALSYDWLATDLVWIDNYQSSNTNVVLSFASGAWTVIRNKPTKINPASITTASVYNNTSTISDQQLLVTTPLIDDLTIIDPLCGLFPGAATKDINFTVDYDPAIYSFNNTWTNTQIGQVWWNTSTVKYLDPYTDALGKSDQRDFAELQYRISSWASIAPNTSVDVYEWTQSTLNPTDYATTSSTDTTGTYGTVYNTTSYTTNQIYSSSLQTYVTYYYFWVSNLTVVPNVPFRSTSVYDIASLLTSPISQGLEWIAAVSENAILLSGVNTYLNNTASVVKVELDTPSTDHAHAQWTLMRPNDPQSLPPEWLWRKIRDSLAGFDDGGSAVPNIGNAGDA